MSRRPRAPVLVACAVLGAGCSATDRADDRAPPVVRVTVATGALVPEVATGVATGAGRVVTVAHALSAGQRVAVGGRPARVLHVDRRLDLAVLAVPGLRAPAVRLGDAAGRVAIGVLRAPGARTLEGTIRRRVVIRWRDQPRDPPRLRPGLEVAARIDPGDSGAPVLDRRGRLLGVLFARSSERPGTAWAVDASAVKAVLGR
jgi:S1-C subfamily serine protease